MELKCESIRLFVKSAYSYLNGSEERIKFLSFLPSSYSINQLYDELDQIRPLVKQDLAFFLVSDPAADSEEEIKIAYPGFKAICYHRIANIFYKIGEKVTARIIGEEAHLLTGIDIHPGATIGCPFFIDHGTGIVIGETAIIGSYVKIYQGVTLGALSLAKGSELRGTKRHPTVGDYVTIYSGASVLGDITIGNRVTIGSNVFLLDSVPDDCKVTLPKPELIIIKR